MKAERSVRENGRMRALFCLFLVAALICGVFAVNSFAAGADPADLNVKVVSCSTHTAAVSDGSLYVWGSNENSQFPESDAAYSVEPLKVAEDVTDVAVSDNRTLVVYNNGDLYAYGRDPFSGEIQTAEKLGSHVSQVNCSDSFGLYVTTSGILMGWGSNGSGQLGSNAPSSGSLTPVKVMEDVSKAVAGADFVLALKKDGALYGWGSNAFFEIGLQQEDGSSPEIVSSPVQIMDDVKDIDAGSAYSCILKQDGSLYTCGMNDANQTGADSMDSAVPLTKILDGINSVAAGDTHGFAVAKNGTVYSWGFGLSGQLGDGTRQRGVGASASDLDFVQMFAGEDTSFGVDSEGAIWAWGANTNRLLCTASGVDASEPVKVLNADMSWADVETEVPDDIPTPVEPDHSVPGVEETPLVVKTPFISGDGNGSFRPEDSITRAEFLRMVVTALTDYDKDADQGSSTFTDVDNSKWYAPYVAYAQKAGLIAGYQDGTCRPEENITRAEAARITASALNLTSNVTTSSFTDVKERWCIPAIEALAKKGILSGDGDGAFRPNDSITRAEAAKVVAAYSFDPQGQASSSAAAKTASPFADVQPQKWYYPYVLYAAGVLES